jgi:hypothetical protein
MNGQAGPTETNIRFTIAATEMRIKTIAMIGECDGGA